MSLHLSAHIYAFELKYFVGVFYVKTQCGICLEYMHELVTKTISFEKYLFMVLSTSFTILLTILQVMCPVFIYIYINTVLQFIYATNHRILFR